MSALGTAGPSSTSSDHNVALYTVLVNGQQIDPQLAKDLREVKIQSYLRLPDVCMFSVAYPRGTPGEDQPVDSNPFDVGATLEVKLGANDDLTTTSLFKGQIVSLDLNFGAAGVELLCRGYDRAHILMRGRKRQTFQNMTASDIVSKIVQAAGFTCETDASGDPYTFMQQNNETDWDFIWRLAERIGFEFVVHDTEAHFRKPDAHHSVELEWPTTLRSFRPRLTAVQQARRVTAKGWDPKTAQEYTGTASSATTTSNIGVDRDQMVSAFDPADVWVATEAFGSQSEADTLAQALLDKLADGYIAGDGICDGNPDIRPGESVQISGIGTKYSGIYRVGSVTHVLRGGSTYETHFSDLASPTLAGTFGSDRGGAPDIGSQLVVGIVTNNNDPEHLGRVRVRFPALGDDVEGTWTRIVSVAAGKERGLSMLPTKDREVLVGFEHGDTTRPYVLGGLFNGSDQPGDELNQNEDGSFALLSDQKIVATAKDEMKLTSTKDLTARTEQDMTVVASHGITVQAGDDIAVKGSANYSSNVQQAVTIEAGQSITIKSGSSSITIDSSGVTIQAPSISLE